MAGLILSLSLLIVFMFTFILSSTQDYTITVTTNSCGEFFPELMIIIFSVIVLGHIFLMEFIDLIYWMVFNGIIKYRKRNRYTRDRPRISSKF